jgi:hypothetical protein
VGTAEKRTDSKADWLDLGDAAKLTIGGLVLYGVLRLVAANFYLQLGIAPEDVGLTYSALLQQWVGLTTIVILIVSLDAGIATSVIRLLRWLKTLLGRRTDRASRLLLSLSAGRVGRLGAAAGSAILIVVAYRWTEHPSGGPVRILAPAFGLALLLLLVPIRVALGGLSPAEPNMENWLRAYLRPLTLVLVLVVLLPWAGSRANDVIRGKGILPGLGLKATPVHLVWVNDHPPPRLGRVTTGCVTYLGSSNGFDYYWIGRGFEGGVLQIPTGQTAMKAAGFLDCSESFVPG